MALSDTLNQIRDTCQQIHTRANKIIMLSNLVESPIFEEIGLTQDQKQILITRYTALRAELEALVASFPDV